MLQKATLGEKYQCFKRNQDRTTRDEIEDETEEEKNENTRE